MLSTNPEKWWSESPLGWWHSQLFLESHNPFVETKPPTTYESGFIIPTLCTSAKVRPWHIIPDFSFLCRSPDSHEKHHMLVVEPYPSEKWWSSSVGVTIHKICKNKKMFQTTKQISSQITSAIALWNLAVLHTSHLDLGVFLETLRSNPKWIWIIRTCMSLEQILLLLVVWDTECTQKLQLTPLFQQLELSHFLFVACQLSKHNDVFFCWT